ncbi:MAG: type III glutamate--ammonia ligase [Gammaproteobacteria bacterium]|nr:type III glutamate--ammonia ligase [Gammaproteobacteria bacterium]
MEIEQLQKRCLEQGVKYGLASYVDIHGASKGKFVPVDHFAQMFAGSELFTGAALDGVPQDISDDEVAAMPDPDSMQQCQWNPEVAWFASDLFLGGKPFEACSRNILKRQLARAESMGFTFNLGIETEFFVLRESDSGRPVPMSDRDTLEKPCYDVPTMMDNLPVIDELVQAMSTMGWGVYSFDHEDANGQFEIDFRYADALTMADRLVYFRLLANEIARKHGAFASFMPKPFADRTGSGAHYNMSLASLDGADNLFAATTDNDRYGCGVSELAYQFIGGVLRHAKAISAVVAPTVNSYKRLVRQGSMSGSTWAPVFCCYGNNNRTNMLRIPGAGARVECRAPDIACNPYLGAALMLAAGLEGIEQAIDPGEPHRENMYNYSDREIADAGIECLPRTLSEATDAIAVDPLAQEVLGADMHKAFVAFKRAEWNSYHNTVSDWEMQRYLRLFG